MHVHKEGISPCFPNATSTWTPEHWVDEVSVDLPAEVTLLRLFRVCSTVRLHTIQTEALHFIQSDAAWFKYTIPRIGQRSTSECVAALAAWRPRSCTLENVHVWGSHRRLFNGSHYFIPPSGIADQRRQDAELISSRNNRRSCSRKGENKFGAVGSHAVCNCFPAPPKQL